MQLESLDSLDLARHVRPGDGVIFQQGCGEALSVAERFVQQRASYSGARVFMGSGFSRSFLLWTRPMPPPCRATLTMRIRPRRRKPEKCSEESLLPC